MFRKSRILITVFVLSILVATEANQTTAVKKQNENTIISWDYSGFPSGFRILTDTNPNGDFDIRFADVPGTSRTYSFRPRFPSSGVLYFKIAALDQGFVQQKSVLLTVKRR